MSGQLTVGQWMVRDTGWHFEVVQIAAVTAQQVRWLEGKRECRGNIASVMAFGPDEAAMRKAAAQLTSAKAEMTRRERAARVWFANEKDRIREAAALSRTGRVS